MFYFFRRKHKSQTGTRRFSDVAAGKIAGGILGLQQRWADTMARLTRNWTTGQKKAALLLFLLLLGANSGIALYQVFHKPSYRKLLISPGGMAVPHLQPANTPAPDRQLLGELRAYRRYLDSLSHDSAGIVLYRRLVATRPGLIDSLDFLNRQFPQP